MERKTLKEVVYQQILKSIVNGEYTAGQVLNEQGLIEKFGYSKSPIREALIMLCNEGVLRNIPRYGYEVVRLTANDISEIMAYRRILECGLLQNCFNSITKKQLNQLKDIYDTYWPLAEDALTHWNNNQTFHLTLAGFANNEYAYKQLQSTMKILRIAYAQTFWNQWDTYSKEAVNLHIEIINAIEANDKTRAISALRNDLMNLK